MINEEILLKLDKDICELTEELKKLNKGLANSSLVFKQGYTGKPDITYDDPL